MKTRTEKQPLWRCPKCGHRFVTPNIWHSCSRFPLDYHFAGRDPKLRQLFDAYLRFVERFGPVTVIAQKTRICFQVRVRFAGAVVRKRWIECGFWLKRRVDSPRFHRIETYTPRDFGHFFRLTDLAQLDAELAELMREAYAVGCQEHRAATK